MSAIAQLAAMLDTNAALDCGLDSKQTEVAALQCELAGKRAEVATAREQAANLQQHSDQLQKQVAHLTHKSTMLQDSISKQAADNAKALQLAGVNWHAGSCSLFLVFTQYTAAEITRSSRQSMHSFCRHLPCAHTACLKPDSMT